jgi:hypothetical protein
VDGLDGATALRGSYRRTTFRPFSCMEVATDTQAARRRRYAPAPVAARNNGEDL